jgi:hypothetical protein
VRLWYDRKMPADWNASEAEWEWFCFRAKGRDVSPEPGKNDVKAGSTAGWRTVKRVDVPSDPRSIHPTLRKAHV